MTIRIAQRPQVHQLLSELRLAERTASVTYHGAQLAAALAPDGVWVAVCVDTFPVGVEVPAKVKSMTPINSAARA